MKNDRVVVFRSFRDAIRGLPDDVRLEILEAIIDYGLDGTVTESNNQIVNSLLCLARPIIDRDIKSLDTEYARTCMEYKNWRLSVFGRDNFTCQICGKTGEELNAHHIKPFSIYKELRYDLSNGITLCKSCHINVHKKKKK